ncbi:MAG: phosphoglucosamine mutase [Haloarculaceae archaeon]
MEVFGSSGVRGVVNEDVTPATVMRIAQAAGSVWDGDRAAVGRDTRATGQMLADAAASGLASVGFDVDRLGRIPTPGVQAYCEREGVPALMITASHNPAEYNGVKLIAGDGVECDQRTLERVEEQYLAGEVEAVGWAETGDQRTIESARRTYREGVVAAVDDERIAAADLTVVVDPGHGAGALTSPELFRELGCTVHTVNAQPDGRFPGRDPEPVAAHLTDLCEYVRSTDADLGIAHDGDADRAIFVDERGELISGDAALAALGDAVIEAGDTVVSAVNVSQRLVDVIEAAGAELTMTPIGSTYIVTRIRDRQAGGEHVPIAGEGNGGILFPDYRVARDGAYTAAKFCELIAGRPASEVVAEYDDYANVRRKVTYDGERERAAMLDAVERTAREAIADLNTTDGYRLDYGDGWVLARPSGTEPVVRVYAEARTGERADELAEMMVSAIERGREQAGD